MKRLALLIAAVAAFAMAAPVSAGGRPLTADLSSANEVPPIASGAFGSAHVTLNQGQGQVCVHISTTGLSSAVTGGHIHEAPAGSNGGVVVNLSVDDAEFSGCVDGVDGNLIKKIRMNPGNYYVNIHSDDFAGGEVRGQLSK